MVITKHDKPLAAEDARRISLNNKDDSMDRYQFRELMHHIEEQASWGYTRVTTAFRPVPRSRFYTETVQNSLRSLGYKVVEKRAMQWDEEKKEFSTEKPQIDSFGRELFFIEIMWG